MGPKLKRPWIRSLVCSSLAAVVGGLAASCTQAPPPKAPPRYATLPLKKVPPFMAGSLFERADIISTQPFHVSAYGLVSRLRNTGDSTAPTTVRDWMVSYMVKHGFASPSRGTKDLQPEQILNNPSFAIVQVDGYIPVGSRKSQTFDVMVSALPDSTTTSLAHGWLFDANLGANGANPTNPNVIGVAAIAGGQIFVNPVYSVKASAKTDGAANSLRYGYVMDGGHVMDDWPIVLRLRAPSMSVAKSIDNRINQRFQGLADKKRQNDKGFCVAEAQDEGTVYLYVPESFHGDWEHLVGIVMHLYEDGAPEAVVQKGRQLAEEAVKPDAPLLDISYAWEALGEKALPYIQPLMTSEKPDVAFAAARAAAFLGDSSAVDVLIKMAGAKDHAFQLNATTVLGALPQTQQITQALRTLLNCDAALVRLEAYTILARERDASVYTRVIDEKFLLDIVRSSGQPLIYASRQGIPRVAIIGNRTSVETPLTFTAMSDQLSITSADPDPYLKVFYRGREVREPTTVLSRPDVAELVARLGGEPRDAKDRLNFSYSDILGILQSMADSRKFFATSEDGKRGATASFVLQDLNGTQNEVLNTPAGTSSTDGALPDLVPQDQDKRPLNNGAAGGARPQ